MTGLYHSESGVLQEPSLSLAFPRGFGSAPSHPFTAKLPAPSSFHHPITLPRLPGVRTGTQGSYQDTALT